MIKGLFGSTKGKIALVIAVFWLAFSISLAAVNFPVFYYGMTHGTLNFKDFSTEKAITNQPINGNVHYVYADVTNYYTEYISSLDSISFTDNNNVYLIPFEENSTVMLTVRKNSKTDTELRALLKAVEDGNKDSTIIKNGVWIDAVGFTTKSHEHSLAQDPINDINKKDHKKSITVCRYVIDCSHPYSGYTFRFSFAVFLFIAFFVTVILVIRRIKAVILADERTVRESYIAANRTPPTGNAPAKASHNPNAVMRSNNEEIKTFDSSTRNVDYYNQGEISYGKFQTQGGSQSDDDAGFFGE